jgi:hypothetical protein
MVRSPMQVDDNFRKRIKKIQEEIMKKKGKFTSIPKITSQVISLPEWEILEKKLMGDVKQIEFKINFDRRKKQ